VNGADQSALAQAGGLADGPVIRVLRGALIAIAAFSVAAIIALPIADLVLARIFWKGIASAGTIADHATLVLAFSAAALASLDKRHISLAGGESAHDSKGVGLRAALVSFGDVVAVTTQACLFWASLSLTLTGFDAASLVWIIPTRVIAGIMPLCLALMTAFTIRNAAGADAARRLGPRAIASIGLLLGSVLAASSIRNFAEAAFGSSPAFIGALAGAAQAFVGAYGLPLGVLMVLAVPFGAPIFTVLAGAAAILFVGNGAFIELAPSEAYSLLKGGSISALPLFGIAGILLAESGAGKRFVAVFRELFGWFRGGEAIAAVLACAVFSTFTGINGVTIVALGGILATVLVDSGGLSEERGRGLITASGDIGLLIPPSAAVIVYGVNAQFLYGPSEGFTIVSLFKGALVPGFILIAAMCVAGILMSPKRAPAERSFSVRASAGALKPAALELLVPVLAIVLYFTGLAGLREIGALAVLYIAVVESLVKKELGPRRLVAALGKAFPIVGGTLMVIAAARGLSFYLIDANVPAAFTGWIQAFVHSKFVFLLLLNLFLIVVGCLMDIFSAILVVSPFLIPLGVAFGVPPVQFGVIFIMNLLLGFLTPTVGMNIFLASYTFRKPVPRIVRDVWPFLIVQAAVLLLVTYVPGLSTILK
jgi:tripartite ATP-independent transporter DctM subunit